MVNFGSLKFDINNSRVNRMSKHLIKNSGQATIEFILMLSMILFLVMAHMFYAVAYVKIFIKDYHAFIVTRSAYLGTQTLGEQQKHMKYVAGILNVESEPTLKDEADLGVYKLGFKIIIPKFTLKKSGLLNPTDVIIQVPYRSEVTGDECRRTLGSSHEDNGC